MKFGSESGCVATVDRAGRTIFVADAHRDDGKRFVVRVDEKLTRLSNSQRRFELLVVLGTRHVP